MELLDPVKTLQNTSLEEIRQYLCEEFHLSPESNVVIEFKPVSLVYSALISYSINIEKYLVEETRILVPQHTVILIRRNQKY
jgi:hypothetical protein